MEQKKDIGQFFEQKLSKGKRIPNATLWEKVNISLDKENRRRKRTFIYWFLVAGLSILLALFLLFGNFFNENQKVIQKKNKSTEELNTYSKPENNKNTSEIISVDSSAIKSNSEQKKSKITTTKNDSLSKIIKNTSKSIPKKISTNNSPKYKSVDENFTVSKKYYYYNSKDGKQLVTNNKKEIDSLILSGYKSLDSLKQIKIDSLE